MRFEEDNQKMTNKIRETIKLKTNMSENEHNTDILNSQKIEKTHHSNVT